MRHPKRHIFSRRHLSKATAKKLSKTEEEAAARLEQRVMDGEVAAPETKEEFERVVMASPNSSLCWIQYMAFHMQVTILIFLVARNECKGGKFYLDLRVRPCTSSGQESAGEDQLQRRK